MKAIGVTSTTGKPGMTARLTVHYRSPSPLFQALRFIGGIDHIVPVARRVDAGFVGVAALSACVSGRRVTTAERRATS